MFVSRKRTQRSEKSCFMGIRSVTVLPFSNSGQTTDDGAR